MKIFKVVIVLFSLSILVMGCKSEKKMTVADYLKIDAEIALPEPAIDAERVKKISEKYGFTSEQYIKFYEKAQKDEKLQQELGDVNLKKNKE